MLSISSNLSDVLGSVLNDLRSLAEPNGADRDKLTRMVASDVITQLHERIHVNGQNTAGQEFGTYSNAYLKRRQKENLSGTKIILRFEGQLEKLTIVGGSNGSYQIGWLSENNLQKAKWMEERYGKIYELNQAEQDHAVLIAEDFINQMFSK